MRPKPRREREKAGRLRRDSLFSSLVGVANRYHFEYQSAFPRTLADQGQRAHPEEATTNQYRGAE